MKMILDRFSEFENRNISHMWKNTVLHIFKNQWVFCILELMIYASNFALKKKSIPSLTEVTSS